MTDAIRKDGSIDIATKLNINHSKYRKQLTAIALKDSKDYFDMRATVEDKLKGVIEVLYHQVYYLLTAGQIKDSPTATASYQLQAGTINLNPSIDMGVANSIAQGLAVGVNEALNDLLDEILPVRLEEILSNRLVSEGTRIFRPQGSLA